MLIYALTIFISAFLLFQVQPLAGKFVLPWFGGGAVAIIVVGVVVMLLRGGSKPG